MNPWPFRRRAATVSSSDGGQRTHPGATSSIFIAQAALVVIVGTFLVGCYTGPGADHFEAVLDELSIPQGWTLAESTVMGPDEEEKCDPFSTTGCPTAVRTYLTDSDADVAYAHAKDIVTEAGFDIEDTATRDCSTRMSSGLPCYVFAHRGDDDLYVTVFASASEAGIEDDLPGVVPVMIQATSN